MRALKTIVTLLIIQSVTCFAAPQPNWPCVQRLVPTLSPAHYWTEPLSTNNQQTISDENLDALVNKLTTLSVDQDAANRILDDYVKQHPLNKVQREQLYLRLFAESNKKRTQLIDSIQTFTESQRNLAARINQQLAEIEKKDLTAEKRSNLEKLHQWDLRVYTQRESNAQALCEKPGLMEQRIALLAKRLQSMR